MFVSMCHLTKVKDVLRSRLDGELRDGTIYTTPTDIWVGGVVLYSLMDLLCYQTFCIFQFARGK